MKRFTNQCLIAILFFVVATLTGCGDLFKGRPENLDLDRDFKEAQVNDEYEVKVPHYTTADKSLHDDASLGYANLGKEVYIIVIDEPKDTLIEVLLATGFLEDGGRLSESLLDVQLSALEMNAEVDESTEPVSISINGLEASTAEVVAKVEDISEKVVYFVTCIEGDANAYTMMCWTMASRREKYRDTFTKVANSFKLLRK